jgi:glycosyltransferase involved in cell wall biosynthesis
MIRASVIVPTFNRWPMLAEAITSVMAQGHVDFELIIVDDGSFDDTAVQLPILCEELATAPRPIRILRSENRGAAAARNFGAASARAPLIAFLDSDDLWLPDKLYRQLDYMRLRPHCIASQTDEIWLRDGVRVNPGSRHRKRGGDFFIDSLRTCLVSPSSVMIRTNIFHELGGFDEGLLAAEDYDLWLRLLLEHQVEFLPEALVVRRAGHPGQLSATVPAVDRFRILALLKLLFRDDLGAQQRAASIGVLIEKCRIYSNGLDRRGNLAEATFIRTISRSADQAWRDRSDSSLGDVIHAMRTWLTVEHPSEKSSSASHYEPRRS